MTQAVRHGVSLEAAVERPLLPTAIVSSGRLAGLPTLITAFLSLLLHGVALAALIGWSGSAQVEMGDIQTIEVLLVESASPTSGARELPSQREAQNERNAEKTPSVPYAVPPQSRFSRPTLATKLDDVAATQSSVAKVVEPVTPPRPMPEQASALSSDILSSEPPVTVHPEAPLLRSSPSSAEKPQEASPAKALPSPPPIKPAPPLDAGVAYQQALTPRAPIEEPREQPGDRQTAALPDHSATLDAKQDVGAGDNVDPIGSPASSDSKAFSGAGGSLAVAAPGNRPPAYPNIARRRGQEGLVLLRVEVTPAGQVAAVQIATSSGHSILDRAAVDAVEDWRFQPAVRAGQSIAATLEIPVRFRLTD